MLSLQNVKMRYPTGDGVENITFSINRGEFAFLVGPSGAGKSTVLKLIYMDEMPQEGHLVVNDFSSLYMTKREVPYLRRKLGIVFQDFKLFADRTVYENVAFSLYVTNVRRNIIKRKVLRTLADVGLSHKRYKMPHELSGGEQQRVAIARALVNDPYIVLADEPTGNLDPETAADIMALLEKINSGGTAILMATHNYELVSHFNKRIIRIENGRII